MKKGSQRKRPTFEYRMISGNPKKMVKIKPIRINKYRIAFFLPPIQSGDVLLFFMVFISSYSPGSVCPAGPDWSLCPGGW